METLNERREETAVSKSEREALKAIYRLTKDGDDAHTGDLAEALGVSPGTATALVKRFAERGVVDHKPYRGVVFTGHGRKAAVAAIRRHRIVERFLADMLGYAWNEADRLAASFEHELPHEVEERIYQALHRPATCPHGFPIPAPEVAEIPPMPPLYALEPGDVATVAVPGSTDAEVVTFLDQLGLRPGVRVEVREKHPFDGPLVLRVDGSDRTLGHTVANQVFVQQEGGREATSADPTQPPTLAASGGAGRSVADRDSHAGRRPAEDIVANRAAEGGEAGAANAAQDHRA